MLAGEGPLPFSYSEFRAGGPGAAGTVTAPAWMPAWAATCGRRGPGRPDDKYDCDSPSPDAQLEVFCVTRNYSEAALDGSY